MAGTPVGQLGQVGLYGTCYRTDELTLDSCLNTDGSAFWDKANTPTAQPPILEVRFLYVIDAPGPFNCGWLIWILIKDDASCLLEANKR